MSVLTPFQIADYARKAGFPEEKIRTMTAIAMAESGGKAKAHNPNASTGDNSFGLFQINMLGGMGPERRKAFGINSNEQLFDPGINAKAAKSIFDSQGLNAWSVYRSGKYKDYLPEVEKNLKENQNKNLSPTAPVLTNNASATNTIPGMPAIEINIGNLKNKEQKENSDRASFAQLFAAQALQRIMQNPETQIDNYYDDSNGINIG